MEFCPLSKKPCDKPKNHYVTEVKNGERHDYYLCEKCANVFFDDGNCSRKKRIELKKIDTIENKLEKISYDLKVAIEKENYLEAGILKKRLDVITAMSEQKKSIEELITRAVLDNDFETAKKLKSDIEKINLYE